MRTKPLSKRLQQCKKPYIVMDDWVQTWEQEQRGLSKRLIDAALVDNNYRDLYRISDGLHTVTTKKFTALKNAHRKLDIETQTLLGWVDAWEQNQLVLIGQIDDVLDGDADYKNLLKIGGTLQDMTNENFKSLKSAHKQLLDTG